MHILKLILATVLAGAVFSGCSMNRFIANRTADMFAEASTAFNEEQDVELVRQAMPANLKMLDGMQRVSPENPTLLTMLAQGYCSYAFGFIEDSGMKGDVDRAKQLYRRGFEYGLAALPEDVRKTANGSLEDFEKHVGEVGKGDVAPLFWTAYCLGGWVNLNKGDIAAVGDLPKVEMMMRRVLALDEQFYYGSAHIFYGVYYGSRPKMLGGDPKKAREHLDRALALSDGRFLMSKVYLAQFVAVPTQDEGLFDSTLKNVVEAPVDLLPAEKLANQIAKRRAVKLQQARKDLF